MYHCSNIKFSFCVFRLNGLPLAFNNKRVKLLSRMAEIVADQPYVHFNVETDLILFKPKHGDVLQVCLEKINFAFSNVFWLVACYFIS